MYRSLIDYMTFEGAITVYFASDRPGVVEHDIELMKEWCRENGIVEVVNVSGSNEEYVEDEKNDIRSIPYQIIKNSYVIWQQPSVYLRYLKLYVYI